jgi:hypothetical protein
MFLASPPLKAVLGLPAKIQTSALNPARRHHNFATRE